MTTLQELANVLIRPVITEKSTLLQEQGRYTFCVAPAANRMMVKQAVEKLFSVDVVRVNIVWVKGKSKRYGMRPTRRSDWKKAVVSLRPGQRIQFFEGL
jgi:large subunit ribosomal protein L23